MPWETHQSQRCHPSRGNQTHILPWGSVQTAWSHFHHKKEGSHRACKTRGNKIWVYAQPLCWIYTLPGKKTHDPSIKLRNPTLSVLKLNLSEGTMPSTHEHATEVKIWPPKQQKGWLHHGQRQTHIFKILPKVFLLCLHLLMCVYDVYDVLVRAQMCHSEWV